MKYAARLLGAFLLASMLSACGGGGSTETTSSAPDAPMRALPPPAAAQVDASLCTPAAIATGQYQQVEARCMRGTTTALMAKAASQKPLAAAAPLTASQAMDWAELHYPTLFPTAGRTSGFLAPYTYRYYPQTRNYLGVSTASADVAIYLFGEIAGWQISRYGTLSDYTCTVLPQNCAPALEVSPTSLIMEALEAGNPQQKFLSVLPVASTATLSVTIDSVPYAPWLSADVADAGSVRVTASPTSVAASVQQGAVLVKRTDSAGISTTVRVPVTFTVGAGLVTPAAQAVTLNAASSLGGLGGAVSVARADGASRAWTATSSQPWLTVTASGNSTPATLAYSVDPTAATSLPNFSDATATATISSLGVTPVSFTVTLAKRLPYLNLAMPYGINAGSTTRVMAGGAGFLQYAHSTPQIQSSGLVLSNVQVLSDTLLSFNVTPASVGSYALSLGNAASIATTQATLSVTPADGYSPSGVAHDGYKDAFVQDPVRKAIYALSRLGNAVYRFQYSGASWTVTALAVNGPLSLAITPDGARLLVTTGTSIKQINPDTMTVSTTYQVPGGIQQGYSGALAISADNRMWLPGSYYAGHMVYFDLNDNTVKSLPGAGGIESASFNGSADGSVVLASPDYCCTPRQLWHLYNPIDQSVSNPMGANEFWYDARVSNDGSRTMVQTTGQVFDANYELLGQLPLPSGSDFYARMALTPDGGTIMALRYDSASGTYQQIELFSTRSFASGTTNFVKTGSIPLTQQTSGCGPTEPYYCSTAGYLVAGSDGKSVFWFGNLRMDVFKLP